MKKYSLIFLFLVIFLFGLFLLLSVKETPTRAEWILKAGNHYFNDDLLIEKGQTLKIMPGATLSFAENKRLLVKGKINAQGTKENPIIFRAGGDYFWRGIKIQGQNSVPDYRKYWQWLQKQDRKTKKLFFKKVKNNNIFTYCHFQDISNQENKLTKESRWIGAIEAYSTSLFVSNSNFKNIEHLGGVVTQRTYSLIRDNHFSSEWLHKQINLTKNSVGLIFNNKISAARQKKQGCADAIWIVDSTALIYANTIKGVADDAINTIRSYTIIGKNNIFSPLDDGIDIEMTRFVGASIIFDNIVEKASESGIKLTKSESILVNNEIKNSKNGLVLRNGSTALAKKMKIKNNTTGIMAFNSIACALTQEDFFKIKNVLLDDSNKGQEICREGFCVPEAEPLTGPEIVSILEKAYAKKNGYYLYQKSYLDRTIRDVFHNKINPFKLNPLSEKQITDDASFCFSFKNALFLKDSYYSQNQNEKLIFNDFNFKINNSFKDYRYDCQKNDYLSEFKKRKNEYINQIKENIEKIITYSYIEIADKKGEKIKTLASGTYSFPNGLKVSEEETLIIEPGTILLMGEGSRIEVRGKILAKGLKNKPIIFKGAGNNYWRGIKIIGHNEVPDLEKYKKLLKAKNFKESDYLKLLKDGNIFTYCRFENLMTDGKEIPANRVKSAIEANDTAIIVTNCNFSDILHIGCVQTKRSVAWISHNYTDARYVMKTLHFIRSVHITYSNQLKPNRLKYHTWAEGIYTKQGVGIIANNFIQGFPDNGIDNDHSLVYVINNTVKDVYDQGIDIDNRSEAYVFGNKIESTYNDGILISHQSKAVLLNNKVTKANPGISLRNGAKVIAKNIEISECENGIRLFNRVPLLIDKTDYYYIKERFKNITTEELNRYGYYTFKDRNGAAKLLEKSYKQHGEIFVFNQPYMHHDLKNLFKLIDVFQLKEITKLPPGLSKEAIKQLAAYHNELEITESKIAVTNNILTSSFFSIKGDYKNADGKTISLKIDNSLLPNTSKLQNSKEVIKELLAMVEYLEDLIKTLEILL